MPTVQTTTTKKIQVGDSVVYMDTQRRPPTRLAATVAYIYESTSPLRINIQCLNPDGTADHHDDVPCFQSEDEVVDRVNSYALVKQAGGFDRFDEILCRMEERLHTLEERFDEVIPLIQDRIDERVKVSVSLEDTIKQIVERFALIEDRYDKLAFQVAEMAELNEYKESPTAPKVRKKRAGK